MYFYHADLNPTNIFTNRLPKDENNKVEVSDIVDWEVVGYFPPWWIALNPRVSAHFGVSGLFEEIDNDERYWWTWMLSDELMEAGFLTDMERYDEFQKSWRRTFLPSVEGERGRRAWRTIWVGRIFKTVCTKERSVIERGKG